MYVWVVRENRVEQSRTFLGTEVVITHSLAVAMCFPTLFDELRETTRPRFELFRNCGIVRAEGKFKG